VNTSASYDLRAAGADGTFGTADDPVYTVATNPTYTSGLTVSYRVTDGPLQPGNYRFTASANLTDRAGNPLSPVFVRTFTVPGRARDGPEGRADDALATATPLAAAVGGAGDGSFAQAAGRAVGTNPYYAALADVNGDGKPDLVTANITGDNVSVLL